MDVVLQCLFYLNIFLWKAILNTLEMQQTVFYLFLSQKIHIFKIYEKKHCNIILRKQTPNQSLYGLTKNILLVLQTLKSSLHYFLSL